MVDYLQSSIEIVIMVNYCRVVGCTNRSDRETDKQFFRLPAVVRNQGEECRKLSEERRRRWLAILNQDFTHKNLDNIRVCGDHFISGKKSGLYPSDHPDWVPHVNVGTDSVSSPELVTQRFQRRFERKRKSEAAKILMELSTSEVQDEQNDPISEVSTCCGAQTDMNGPQLEALHSELQAIRTENIQLKSLVASSERYDKRDFENDDEKVKYFTGLPTYMVLLTVYMFLEKFLPSKSSLNQFRMFVMTLMKLRLNLSNQFLSYEFNVSSSTVSRLFSAVINVMYVRMKPLVMWPERDTLRKTMPMQFRKHFGTKCAVIIDCFEVFIERPSGLKARAETWSSYKHHNTVKFLLGITPQGVISFISKSWGGRVSDKHITENCGFLKHILPGDLVLADRGFDIQSCVGSMCAEVNIPAFTKGKNQLSPLDVENTRKLANVRIHVERVIGLVRQKYTILNGVLPIDFLCCRDDDGLSTVDKIAHVCCSLVNMCESVVSTE